MTTQFHHINLCAKDPSDLENCTYKDVLNFPRRATPTPAIKNRIKNQGYGGRVVS